MLLPRGTRSLEIAYTALRSQHPDRLRFRYQLDGVDDDWVNVEERRRAIYTNLPPGKHRFQLNVSDEFGSWGTQPTILTFEIPPTFLQSRLFKALCVATLLALLALAYRLRVRHLERRHHQLLVERLDERERIARELHDTLLQGTQALILKVHSATKLVGKDEPIYRVLGKALDQATDVMVEARNRIEDLRVRAGPEDDDLPTVLVRFGQELMQDGSPRFEAFVEGSVRELSPPVLQEAGLIGREALSNAFQHAEAATIELQIEFSDEHFRLRVRDDGIGFDAKALGRPAGGRHWGLPGMQERARTISSNITIWSRPGAGTEIELRVPAQAAYVAAAPRRRWLTLRSVFG
jgi:signal transduction histidine kinase